jgi:hypothetical protein
MIFSDNGMKLQATLTIAALDINTPEKTSVVLHHYGNDYYFDKVWLQGKNYGYEFPLPPAVKSRQGEEQKPYTVAATYAPTAQHEERPTQTSSAPPVAAAPEPVPSPAPAPAPVEEAQNTPPPAPQPMTQPAPAPAP